MAVSLDQSPKLPLARAVQPRRDVRASCAGRRADDIPLCSAAFCGFASLREIVFGLEGVRRHGAKQGEALFDREFIFYKIHRKNLDRQFPSSASLA